MVQQVVPVPSTVPEALVLQGPDQRQPAAGGTRVVTRGEKNKDRFWCRTCKRMGTRLWVDANRRAGSSGEVWACPSGWGFHYGPRQL